MRFNRFCPVCVPMRNAKDNFLSIANKMKKWVYNNINRKSCDM